MFLLKVFCNELAWSISCLIAKSSHCCVFIGTMVGKLSGLSWIWVGVTFGFVSAVYHVWWSVETGINDGFSGSCFMAISFHLLIGASLIAFLWLQWQRFPPLTAILLLALQSWWLMIDSILVFPVASESEFVLQVLISFPNNFCHSCCTKDKRLFYLLC